MRGNGPDLRRADLAGADLRDRELRDAGLRGALLIGADLRGVDLGAADLLGADLRDTDVRGADLTDVLFLTQPQVDAARGDAATRLPAALRARHPLAVQMVPTFRPLIGTRARTTGTISTVAARDDEGLNGVGLTEHGQPVLRGGTARGQRLRSASRVASARPPVPRCGRRGR